MEKMGDKVAARKLAKKAGIPLIPGTNTAVGDKNALKQAKKIGFPLMVKAAAGGGGIGMQIVHSEDELSPIIATRPSSGPELLRQPSSLLRAIPGARLSHRSPSSRRRAQEDHPPA